MVKGEESLTYLRFLDQLRDLAPNLAGKRGTPLWLLLQTYDNLSEDSVNPQERGYGLEEIMNGLCEICKISVRRSFKRNKGGEQVDGAFELNGSYYLVECRWRKEKASGGDVDGLLAKVGRSGSQTLGIFVSMEGWSVHVVSLLKQNPMKRIILVSGKDIRGVLVGDIGLIRMLHAKIEALNVDAEPFRSVEDILSRRAT